ncbi:alpha/beta hydrolase [Streptomyces sp. H27-D2]|uniref:alpha/beta hydrolase n=1 Tax=Streptomyces sp. H27-D2 TaxID=3046304 RepID=UPI002DB9DDC1|nr:alpha/beta hydrolase [Streptomyces sp. H27-D2]MEC4019963.1 alpha/beta hydrolase [Streptomyces sp. H27-D2]
MRAAALYSTLGSLVLTALAAAPAGGATAAGLTHVPPGGIAEARGAAIAAAHAETTGIRFGRCPSAEGLTAPVQCGTVSVPLDYAEPSGKKISLTISRARATGTAKKRQGALLYNPGGPGGSAMDFPLYAGLPEWARTAKAYDFVGYAPRGVGRSAPLSCQDPAQFAKAPTQSRQNPSAEFKRRKIEEARAYADGCARKAGEGLRHYTTLNNARDLDTIRAALGEKRLNFMGASYGTYFGAVYATLFPAHVRRMVFDSVVNPDPGKIWYRNNLDQSLAFEVRWADWRRWAARHDDVYHLGGTARQVQRSYEKVRDRVDRKPAGGKVGSAQLQSALLTVGYNDYFWPRRAEALSKFLSGDPKPLISQAAPKRQNAKASENGNAVYTAVECNDAYWPRNWAVWDWDNTELARKAPFETWDNTWMNLPCASWQAKQQLPVDISSEPGELPPVLLLAAERDAATPYSGALELQNRLPGSALVTEKGSGTHGIAFGPNGCVNRHTEKYLLTGATPARNVDCAPRAEPKAPPFK